ncbi:MAG: agmatinase [Acidimicrobiia bacterium]|nr:agmatinase [Acidimicrobiia bacterium]
MTDYAGMHGWDRPEFVEKPDSALPAYLGSTSFAKRPLIEDVDEISARRPDAVIVGAPLDEGTTYRPGARFGPRAIRVANNNYMGFHSLQLGVDVFEVLEVFDAGDANIEPIWMERAYAMIYRKVLGLAETGTIPIVLGGDHGITWPSASAIAAANHPARIGMVHFDAHADTGEVTGPIAGHGSPMRQLLESGAIAGTNFVQVGLRGYWPDRETLAWMKEQGFKTHFITEIEEHGAEAVVDRAIEEALDGTDAIYLSIDIDVLDPAHAPGTGTAEPGGLSTRELLRAVRRIVGAVDLAGMDVVEVSPPYDHAELTSMAANRVVMEALSGLALKKQSGVTVRRNL